MSKHLNDRHVRDDDLLAAYELDLLDTDERIRFEAATRDNPELLEELFDMAPGIEAMRDDPARYAALARKELAAQEPGLMERISGWFAVLSQPRFAAPLVISAGALALMLLLPDGDKALRNFAILEPMATSSYEVRAGAPEADELYHDAIDAYLDTRWADAASTLESALAAADADWGRADQARLYLGSSLLLDGRADVAAPVLELAVSSPLPPISERAAWQLIQARLVLGDAEGARSTLAGLTSSPVFGTRAKELLESLKLDQ